MTMLRCLDFNIINESHRAQPIGYNRYQCLFFWLRRLQAGLLVRCNIAGFPAASDKFGNGLPFKFPEIPVEGWEIQRCLRYNIIYTRSRASHVPSSTPSCRAASLNDQPIARRLASRRSARLFGSGKGS